MLIGAGIFSTMEADMRRMVVAVPLAALLLVGWLTPVTAQETKSARGTVTAMAGDSLTVKAGEKEMKFTIDAKTTVTAEGAGTAAREAEKAGKAGLRLSDVVKVGDAVEVSYHEMGGTLHAARVRRVASAGPGGGTTSDQRAETRTETANGTVDSVTTTALTISGSSGGGASFKQNFTLDANTKLVAEGAGTAAAKTGKLVITEFVRPGDQVTVIYHKMGTTLHAAEVRVRQKAK
jgi:hypothetical protein